MGFGFEEILLGGEHRSELGVCGDSLKYLSGAMLGIDLIWRKPQRQWRALRARNLNSVQMKLPLTLLGSMGERRSDSCRSAVRG